MGIESTRKHPELWGTQELHSDLFKVPMTGGPEELIARDTYKTHHCAVPPRQLCAYSKKENNQLIFTTFDRESVKEHEFGRFTFIDSKGFYDWVLSPGATQIAILQVATGNICLLDLKTHALQQIVVKHWDNFVSMDWTVDGKGLFVSSLQPEWRPPLSRLAWQGPGFVGTTRRTYDLGDTFARR